MTKNPKIAFVIPRYGANILGGAEIHCRWIAERLAKEFSVEILTTCANNAILWENHYSPGDDVVNGLSVKRFPLSNRNKERFKSLEHQRHLNPSRTPKNESREWLRNMGPYSQDLLDYLHEHKEDHVCFIFFTYLFPTTVFGTQIVSDRAFLVPTVHNEPYVYLSVYDDMFKSAQGIFFNSEEEKIFTLGRFSDMTNRHVVVGCGIDYTASIPNPSNFKKKYGIDKPYIVYVGKISAGKGCHQLIEFFVRYLEEDPRDIELVLIGTGELEIPKHLRIKAVGPVSENEKYSALAGAEALVNPSQNESLSLALLESWAMKTPVLVNGLCQVMEGQSKRSNGGLWYENYAEFRGCLNWFVNNPVLSSNLADGGKNYLESTYNWTTIKTKYLSLIEKFL